MPTPEHQFQLEDNSENNVQNSEHDQPRKMHLWTLG